MVKKFFVCNFIEKLIVSHFLKRIHGMLMGEFMFEL